MFNIVFQILGGAGLLLYGIEIMKDSLEWVSECRGQRLLEASGKSILKSIFAGIVVTGINQKSSATTIMVVGLVNAGMLSLVQAAGVIMGANIGTTITAQILAFRMEFLAPTIVGIAAVFWKYSKTKRVQHMAEIFIGLGIMFIGMIFIEMGFSHLSGYAPLESYLVAYAQPYTIQYLVLILIGFLVTSFVRSSSLVTGLMIAMSAQGLLPIEMAIPLIMGINVGKCISAIWDSRDAGRTAKRAAMIHLLFNLFGTIIVAVFFQSIMADLITLLSPDNLPRQIANAHTLFNLGTTILCIPFIKLFVIASDRLVPAKKKQEQETGNLDVRMLDTPGLALAQTYNEIIALTKMAFDSFQISFRCVQHQDERNLHQIEEIEERILRSQKDIEVYLVKLAQKNITKDQHEMLNLLLEVSGDIERISDLSRDIAELAIHKRENSIYFSQDAEQQIVDFHEKIHAIARDITKAMEEHDTILANSILSAEIKIKHMETTLRENHIERLSKGICNPGSGVLFIDLINSMEHVAQHIKKIGYFVIEVSKH
jgi:phosphate:Na+ symporter